MLPVPRMTRSRRCCWWAMAVRRIVIGTRPWPLWPPRGAFGPAGGSVMACHVRQPPAAATTARVASTGVQNSSMAGMSPLSCALAGRPACRPDVRIRLTGFGGSRAKRSRTRGSTHRTLCTSVVVAGFITAAPCARTGISMRKWDSSQRVCRDAARMAEMPNVPGVSPGGWRLEGWH